MPVLAQRRRTTPRLRAFAWFLFACLYAVFAHEMARRFAHLLAPELRPLTSRLLFLLLLVTGFAAMGASGQKQPAPLAAMGFPSRPGCGREWTMGAALGWGGAVASVLPSALFGGLLVSAAPFSGRLVSAVVYAVLMLLTATLTQELLFRGYPFQRFADAAGTTFAVILSAIIFAIARSGGSLSPTTFTTSLLLGFLLSLVYLRTRALWMGWGLHFAWNASLGLLFGLPLPGVYSPVFSTYSEAPGWLAGGGYGPEGALFTLIVLLALLFAATRATRELRHRWALPEIVPGGIPVDLDAASRRQHEAAMGSPPEQPLVQILPAEPRKHDSP